MPKVIPSKRQSIDADPGSHAAEAELLAIAHAHDVHLR